MIVSEHRHSVICDGCGLQGPQSTRLESEAETLARNEGWSLPINASYEREHWCPQCAASRKEQP